MIKQHQNDIDFMQRALDLAEKGKGKVAPNPFVGCVIVKDGKILAEGYHKKFGGEHAEVVALKRLGFQARGATMYVTLEPCHHYGKTPPCVDAVIQSGIKRVVIALKDPNPKTNGKSIRKLKKAGIEVTTKVLEENARWQNRFFIKSIQTGMPYVIGKVAQSLNSKITTCKGKKGWITGKEARKYVQNLRQSVSAVLVGWRTVEIDDPQLNVRNKKHFQPRRIVLDPELKIKTSYQIFTKHGGDLFILTSQKCDLKKKEKLEKAGAQVLKIPSLKNGKLNLQSALRKLGTFGINSLLVEGGAGVFTQFAEQELVDEWQFLIAPRLITEQGLSAFCLNREIKLQPQELQIIGDDFLLIAHPEVDNYSDLTF